MSAGVQAVIMAGGEGSRLRPLTSNLPKPMLPVANRPLMEHIVELLAEQGFTEIIATVQFLGSLIRNYFGDGSDLGVSLSYATEEVPLGTAGSVRAASELIQGPFAVISGDALTDLDLSAVVDFHRERRASATIVLKRMEDPREFGIVMTSPEGRVERFLEKPTWGQVFSDTINTGIYVLEPEVLDLIPLEQTYDFSGDVFPAMLDKGLDVFGFVTDAYWTDVGTTGAYHQAHRDVLDRRVRTALTGFELRPGVFVGDDAEIDGDARIEGPVLIGDNVRVAAGAVVGPYASVGDGAVVGEGAVLAHAISMDLAQIERYAQIRGGIVGRGTTVEKGATVEEGAVLADDVTVGAGAIVKSGVRVYPSRVVDAGAIVTESVVRERRASRGLFGSRGVAGTVNLAITPLTAVRLGMAFGSILKRGSVVITGRDPSRAARAMKRALISGLNSAGVTCHDLELAPLPLTRFTVRAEQAAGGVSVRTSPGDPEAIEIRLFDADGADLGYSDQRRIERIFFREDYRRAGPYRLGELEYPARTLEQYVSGLLGVIDANAIRRAGLKVVVDFAYGPPSVIAPSVFGRLGCDVLAVNAFTDEHRPVLVAQDLRILLDRLEEHVRNSGSDMGILLEPGGEVAHLLDDTGRVVPHEQALLAFIRHETSRRRGAVAVPVSSPAACEELTAANGGSLRWTSTALPSLMARAGDDDVVFAGNSDGMLIFPHFLPAPDGLMTFCKSLELIAADGKSLSTIVDDLPKPHVVRRDVPTPWRYKGAVMRRLASSAHGRVFLLDGVKIVEDGRWALVIPYPDEPQCRIWAEAPTPTEAESLADDYARAVAQAVDDAARESIY